MVDRDVLALPSHEADARCYLRATPLAHRLLVRGDCDANEAQGETILSRRGKREEKRGTRQGRPRSVLAPLTQGAIHCAEQLGALSRLTTVWPTEAHPDGAAVAIAIDAAPAAEHAARRAVLRRDTHQLLEHALVQHKARRTLGALKAAG